jgi:hypothetical protein
MRFSFWFYTCKTVAFLFLLVFMGMLFGAQHRWLSVTGSMATATLVVLCSIGAVMGFMLALGRLKMLCPFCGKPGDVGGSKQEGMWMECDQCGFIHGAGFMRMRIAAEVKDAEQRTPSNPHSPSAQGADGC